jgi:protein involved in polysaccharide export with SLBB domain
LRRTALAFGLIACAAAAITIASVRLTADEVPLETADAPDLAYENDETSVIRFTVRLEIRHERHQTLLREPFDAELTLLSGQSNVHSSTYRGFTSTLSMEGTLVDGSIDLSGNVQIRQRGGFRTDDQSTIHRMDRPFNATLSLSEGEQRIELGRDREGRIVSLFLTPTLLGQEERVEWLLDEIGRRYQSVYRSRSTLSTASLLDHAKALHAAAEGIVSTERTQRLVEAFASLHESIINDDGEGIEESLESIPPIGNALREDLDAWRAAARAADDPFADSAGRAGGQSLFGRPSTMFGGPSTGHDEEATRDAETSPSLFGPVDEEKTMLRITVLGEVNRPGVYELDPGSTIIHALGHAGGWTGTARLNRVQIHRGPERLLTDVDAMLFGDGDVMSIEDGDVIIVAVRVAEYAPREIAVLGAVRSPGTQEFPTERNEVDIVEVVARAGGFTDKARSNAVSVTRTEENGRERTFTVDVNSMVTGSRGGSEERFKILPGDVIWVPERVF